MNQRMVPLWLTFITTHILNTVRVEKGWGRLWLEALITDKKAENEEQLVSEAEPTTVMLLKCKSQEW